MTDERLTLSWPVRFLGILPITFYAVHFHYNWGLGNPGHGLWMCHVSNVVLGLGLLFGLPGLIRVAVIWQIPGIPLWIMDMLRTGLTPVITFFSHLGGLSVGLAGLWNVRAHKHTWLYALLWYLFVQQVCRMVTPPALNVNIAHTMYVGWERVFGAYWQYWLFTTACAACGLWVLGHVLLKLMPPRVVSARDGIAESAEDG